jgi:hypothetical protein
MESFYLMAFISVDGELVGTYQTSNLEEAECRRLVLNPTQIPADLSGYGEQAKFVAAECWKKVGPFKSERVVASPWINKLGWFRKPLQVRRTTA